MPATYPTLVGSISARPGGLGAAMQRAAYLAKGLPITYVSFAVESGSEAVRAMRTLGIRGFSVSMPFKQEVMQYLDQVEETALKIGAVNTIVNQDGFLTGYNTDWVGAMQALKEKVDPAGKTAVVVGAGGAARAVVYALASAGCRVRLYDRTESKGRELASDLGAPAFQVSYAGDLQSLERAGEYDIFCNTTSVGYKAPEDSLVPASLLLPGSVVFDVVAIPPETRLIREAEAAGCRVVPGTRMLLHQAFHQFELFTGQPAPREIMEKALVENITNF